MSLEPLINVPVDLQPAKGRTWFTDPQAPGEPPLFTTREVAVVFYGRRRWWLQELLAGDEDVVRETEGLKISIGADGYRRMQLHQIEQITHILFRYGKIDFVCFSNAIRVIKAIADNHQLLDRGTDGTKDRPYRRYNRRT